MNPYLKGEGNNLELTPEGEEYLGRITTNTTGRVYAFKQEADPIAVAASMARLSRSSLDMRKIYLKEFVVDPEQAAKLHERVISSYGDDSVQQLAYLSVVVELTSNLMTKKLEWGRLMAYLEQSTRYIFFDEKINGRYRYYVPTNLGGNLERFYIETMDQIFENYSKLVRGLAPHFLNAAMDARVILGQSRIPEEKSDEIALKNAAKAQACDTIRPMLPVATQSTVGIVGSAQAFENLIMNLAGDELEEARELSHDILTEVRKVAKAFFQRADQPDRGGRTAAYRAQTRHDIRQIARNLAGNKSPQRQWVEVNLIDYTPENELEIIPDILYAQMDLPFREVQAIANDLTSEQASAILAAYFGNRTNRRHRPGRALERIHYHWEVVGDYGTFRDLQRHRMVDSLEWQTLTPYIGYSVPDAVESAGVQNLYHQCFELSTRLYDRMRQEGFEFEAQYATLLGHRMRYHWTINARESFHIHELRTTQQGHPGYRYIVGLMHKEVAKVHPTIAKGMIFVNEGSNPDLTRLEAELATQRKFAAMGFKLEE